MTAIPEHLPEVIDFPDPRPMVVEKKRKISLPKSKSVDSMLRNSNPPETKHLEDGQTEAEIKDFSQEKELEEFRQEQREFADLQAETMERIRMVDELEILLAAREKLLDNRESLLYAKLTDAFPDESISALEKSFVDTTQALKLANQSLAEMEAIIAKREDILQDNRSAASNTSDGARAPAAKIDSYDGVTDESLAEQVAFLQEREAFIEESENVLFDKAQKLQEWEARLEQKQQSMGDS